jgi:hypothetical protein
MILLSQEEHLVAMSTVKVGSQPHCNRRVSISLSRITTIVDSFSTCHRDDHMDHQIM